MANLLRYTLARSILRSIGISSPSGTQLDKTAWWINCTNVKRKALLDQKQFSINLWKLHYDCEVDLPVSNATELIEFGGKLPGKVMEHSEITQATTENNMLHVAMDIEHVKKEVLSAIAKETNSYGFGGLSHKYKYNAKAKTMEELPQNENVIIEYSSPNIAKPFHAGHLRSTILGQFLANLNVALGHRVTRLNYLGDWGTQFGLLGIGFGKYGSEMKLAESPIEHLFDVYVKINQEVRAEHLVHEQGMEFFKRMEQGDSDALEFWKRCRDISIREYSQMYTRLGVQFDEYHGEAMYQEKALDLINHMKQENILEIDPKTGQRFVPWTHNGNIGRTTVLKSDGSTLYITRDIAAFIHRKETYNFDRIHYVVENGQHEHFQHLKKCLHVLNQEVPLSNIPNMHVKFGRIDGMSTRRGEVVFLQDILEEAQKRMLNNMESTHTTKEFENVEKVADVLGISGIIIQDLREKRLKNYPFSWDKMLQFKGDTGLYLQYAHARLNNIKTNCGIDLNPKCDVSSLREDCAIRLVLHLCKFEEIVNQSFVDMEPSYITRYLFYLCRLSNSAIDQLRVKGEDSHLAEPRLLLFHCAQTVLANGMRLLGLNPLPKL